MLRACGLIDECVVEINVGAVDEQVEQPFWCQHEDEVVFAFEHNVSACCDDAIVAGGELGSQVGDELASRFVDQRLGRHEHRVVAACACPDT